jgi:tRNA modification GTPase
MFEDTIAAIGTALGEAGLAVIRVSGSRSLKVAEQVFHRRIRPDPAWKPQSLRELPSHSVHYGAIVHRDRKIDEVLLTIMRAPKTFTREDVVEITCHGGLLPAKLILEALLDHGARLALPGEFTKRAFLNGRIDLAQAEAVIDLIQSRTELALAAAHEQLAGKLSARVEVLRQMLMTVLAHVEAHIDFPDEDIAPDTQQQLAKRLEQAIEDMVRLLQTGREGQILRRGIRTAIIGPPNAGKSSLLNQLLGRERAIVSSIPGTTRDTIEETVNIRGIPVVLVDTAGLRQSSDEIEREGIRRSRESAARAELVLLVLDGSQPFAAEAASYRAEIEGKNVIVVQNKSDLPEQLKLPVEWEQQIAEAPPPRAAAFPDAGPGRSKGVLRRVKLSAVRGDGMEQLKDALEKMVWQGEIQAEMLDVMINARHQGALERARTAADQSLAALRAGLTLELVAVDLRIAVNAIGEIIGKTTTEDLLDSIFSQFCLGK